MTMTVILKRNDTKANLKATLSNESGPVDLTGCTIRFLMSKRRVIKIDREAIIQDATNGVAWFVFEQGDTDTADTFQAEFKVTFPDDRIETFPNAGYISIYIQSDLG
jgi:hypothetical protein